MQTDIQEIYRQTILPLSQQERLQLAALIINDLSRRPPTDNQDALPKRKGGIRELFGSVSLGYATGADNESIDADLARAYADNHEAER